MSRPSTSTVSRPENLPDATPPVVLIHGVGFGPRTLAPVVRTLRDRARTIVLTRRGYESRAHLAPAATVGEHVEDLLAELDSAHIDRAVLAGMSGGATIALAAALTHPERVISAVAHEPAAGSVSPELRGLVGEALATGGGRRLVRVLAGERTWNGLSSSVIAMLEANAALIERDARAFLAFEPSLPPRGSTVSLICTVGEHSRPLRLAVARRLSELTGSAVELIPGCGHLPQFDAPQAFAQMILNHARTGDLQRSSKCH